MTTKVVIGTRGSQLALWQSEWIKDQLQQLNPAYQFLLQEINTKGDKLLDVPLSRIGDKGLFTKELEIALQAGSIDLAVHSLKDLPTSLPAGLVIGAITARINPQDVLVSHRSYTWNTLPPGARVGTSSLRRQAQLHHIRPDLRIESLRGNVPTRLAKLAELDLDAVVLAQAGLERLGLAQGLTSLLPLEVCLPAVGQGTLGVEIRQDDQRLSQLLAPLHHQPTAWAVTAERALLQRLEGGCQVPIGALGRVVNRELHLEGVVASLDGKRLLREAVQGSVEEAVSLGVELASILLQRGADSILAGIYRG